MTWATGKAVSTAQQGTEAAGQRSDTALCVSATLNATTPAGTATVPATPSGRAKASPGSPRTAGATHVIHATLNIQVHRMAITAAVANKTDE